MKRKLACVGILCLAIGAVLGANLQADAESEAPFSEPPEVNDVELEFEPFIKIINDELKIQLKLDRNGQLHATLYVRFWTDTDIWIPVPVAGTNELGTEVIPLRSR